MAYDVETITTMADISRYMDAAVVRGRGTGAIATDALVRLSKNISLAEVDSNDEDHLFGHSIELPDLLPEVVYPTKVKVQRCLRVVSPILTASGLEIEDKLDLLEYSGAAIESTLPYAAIDGGIAVRSEINHARSKAVASRRFWKSVGQSKDMGSQELDEIISRMNVRTIPQQVAFLARRMYRSHRYSF